MSAFLTGINCNLSIRSITNRGPAIKIAFLTMRNFASANNMSYQTDCGFIRYFTFYVDYNSSGHYSNID